MKNNIRFKAVDACLICGEKELDNSINLGNLPSSGYFPKNVEEVPPSGSLELLTCSNCSLTQLSKAYFPEDLYGKFFYGYSSSTNESMVNHLQNLAQEIIDTKPEAKNFLDIGSNDGTLLKVFHQLLKGETLLVGCDPTLEQFREKYMNNIIGVAELFSSDVIKNRVDEKFDIVTCISMFYDLDDPNNFIRNIKEILEEKGMLVIEQSYLPSMVEVNSFDTICHEHLEYYTLHALKKLLELNDFHIQKVSRNFANGGSIRLYASREYNSSTFHNSQIDKILDFERKNNYDSVKPLLAMRDRIDSIGREFFENIYVLKNKGYTIAGYGASTKGNTFLNYFKIDSNTINFIIDRNPNKVGRFTPGSKIPILSEEEGFSKNKVAYLVLPWHFKDAIIKRESERLKKTESKLIFALPTYSEY